MNSNQTLIQVPVKDSPLSVACPRRDAYESCIHMHFIISGSFSVRITIPKENICSTFENFFRSLFRGEKATVKHFYFIESSLIEISFIEKNTCRVSIFVRNTGEVVCTCSFNNLLLAFKEVISQLPNLDESIKTEFSTLINTYKTLYFSPLKTILRSMKRKLKRPSFLKLYSPVILRSSMFVDYTTNEEYFDKSDKDLNTTVYFLSLIIPALQFTHVDLHFWTHHKHPPFNAERLIQYHIRELYRNDLLKIVKQNVNPMLKMTKNFKNDDNFRSLVDHIVSTKVKLFNIISTKSARPKSDTPYIHLYKTNGFSHLLVPITDLPDASELTVPFKISKYLKDVFENCT